MTIVDTSQDFSQGFDEIRKQLLGEFAKIVLLKEDGTTQPFAQLQEISQGWWPDYSTFYSTSTFHVADITALTGNNIRNASFLMIINSNLEAMNNVLYELKSETAPPDTVIPWWRIRAAATSRKYIPPEEI